MNVKSTYSNVGQWLHRHRLTPMVNVVLFALITYAFHKLWWDFHRVIMAVDMVSGAAAWLAEQVFRQSLWFNTRVLGLQIEVAPPTTMLFGQVNGYITVNESCSGLKQFYQISVLFVLFPGPWKQKLWFIPAGWLIMFFTNVFRIIALSLILVWKPEYWNFSHDWILRPFFYVVIFALWVWWVERYGGFFRKQPLVGNHKPPA